jgi:hypothetical protein
MRIVVPGGRYFAPLAGPLKGSALTTRLRNGRCHLGRASAPPAQI